MLQIFPGKFLHKVRPVPLWGERRFAPIGPAAETTNVSRSSHLWHQQVLGHVTECRRAVVMTIDIDLKMAAHCRDRCASYDGNSACSTDSC